MELSKTPLSRKLVLLALAVLLSVGINNFIFNRYEACISEFNAKLANVLRGNHFSIREFDAHGLPYSNFSRTRERTISPFYVIHYGLIYSDQLPHPSRYDYLWSYNSSSAVWNVPPPAEYVSPESFFSCANWVVENVRYDQNGNAHLFYNFDWPYKQLKTGGLKAPWYSGLTDAHALTLLLRAYVLTSDLRYINTAAALYRSTLKPISEGGSLVFLEGQSVPWVEEYVEARLSQRQQPRVLNGMIYASFGIMNYERFFSIATPAYPELLLSIKKSLNRFDAGNWSYYDMIGTRANLKYHKIHISLLNDLYNLTRDRAYLITSERWRAYDAGFFKRNFVDDAPTVNDYMVLVTFILATILLSCGIYCIFYGVNVPR